MTAQLIDGTAIAQKVRDEVKEKVAKRNLLIRQQQKERDLKERAERDKAIGGG